ncbi:hypothetical protein CHS0354_017184 [Potamilus streckersoni]|uniref:Pleckstrin homology domain-containing family M member 2 n=1 Tax=Potamilus streckersoni TaxID=2493646 RepID=A0AAE0T3U9_9BIVA|nr:hypothetical protein CHS0354_017184 [Potamilus streckersoni]
MSALNDRMRLKDKILANISKAVKAIQALQVRSGEVLVLRNNDRECHKLSEHLDHAFLHGLRHVTNGYWKIVAEFTLKETVAEAKRLRNVTTDLGRSRAWLFMALNDCLLESYIRCFQQNEKLVKKYYVRDALVLDQQRLNILLTLTAGLENAVFQLDMDMPYLDLSTSPPKTGRSSDPVDEDRISLCSMDSVASVRPHLQSISQSDCNSNKIGTDSDNASVASNDTSLLSPRTQQYSPSLDSGCHSDMNFRQRSETPTEYEGDYEQEARFRRLEASVNLEDDSVDGSSTLEVIRMPKKSRQRIKKKKLNKILTNDVSGESLASNFPSKSKRNSEIERSKKLNRQSVNKKLCSASHNYLNENGNNVKPRKDRPDSSESTVEGLNSSDDSVDTMISSMESTSHSEVSSEKSCQRDSGIFTEQFKFDEQTVIGNVVNKPHQEMHSNQKDAKDSEKSKVRKGHRSSQKSESKDCDSKISLDSHKISVESGDQFNLDLSQSSYKTEQVKTKSVGLCNSMDDIYASSVDFDETSQSPHLLETNISKSTQHFKDENIFDAIKTQNDSAFVKECTSLKTSSDQPELKKLAQLKTANSNKSELLHNSTSKIAYVKSIHESDNSGECPKKLDNESTSEKSPNQSELRNLNKSERVNKSSSQNVDQVANQNLSMQSAIMQLHDRANDIINKPNTCPYISFIEEAVEDVDCKEANENENNKLYPGEVRLDHNNMLFIMLDVMDENEDFVKMFSSLMGHTEGEKSVIFILISSRSLYLLSQESKDGKFTKEAVIRFSDIDYISLGVNNQLVHIVCKSRKKQYWLTTGEEMCSRAIVDSLASVMERDDVSIKLTVDTDATIQKAGLRKYIATECNCESSEAKLQYYALVHWEDPQTCRGRAGSSEREGHVLYKTQESSGLLRSTTWKPAYAMLRDCMLCIFNDKSDVKPHTIVNLGKEECIGCKVDFNSERSHSLKIIQANGNAFWLSLSTEVETNIWLHSLCQAVSEGLQTGPACGSCLTCCLVLTSQKLMMCHEDLQTSFIRTLGSASLVDITAVLTDPTCKSFCVLAFDSQEAKVSSEKWVLYFSSENETCKFLQALSSCWSELFQVEVPQFSMEDVTLQRKCRDMDKFLKNSLTLKTAQ